MPRRRMIDPNFWTDSDIRKLNRDERLFLIGCISHADDDGRLLGHPAYLKASIFMYDDDLTVEQVEKLRDSAISKMKNLVLYENSGEAYLAFIKWGEYQKPSHPTASKLPAPPNSTESVSESITEPLNESFAGRSGEGRGGEVSQVKDSIGKVRIGDLNFKNFSNTNDLTDYLTTKLTENMLAGEAAGALPAQWGIPILEEFWKQMVGKMSTHLFMGGLKALKEHPVSVVAKAFVKAAKYQGGKHQTWKYIETIIKEELSKTEQH